MLELKTVDFNYFQFLSYFYFLFLLFLFWNLELGISVILQVTVMVIDLCNLKTERPRTNDIIQYSNSILTL